MPQPSTKWPPPFFSDVVYNNRQMKTGTVALLGRPNAGKSTLINNLIQHKVAITSPKPQTTRFPIRAVYEDERGQIIFVDTPGMWHAAPGEEVDLVIYLIDHTRYRGTEENRTLGIVRQFKDTPKILVFNKIDLPSPDYTHQYEFIKDEVDAVVEISALKGTNLKRLLEIIFEYLPESEKPLIDTKALKTPLLNINSKTFLAELIREKVFLLMGEEIPYHIRVEVREIRERDDGTVYIAAEIQTTKKSHKGMLIGKGGQKIKEIGAAARKELEIATNKKVFLELEVKRLTHKR
jgi:GTP-binding protein Era